MTSLSELSLAWNACTQSEWHALLLQTGRSSLEQSWPYGEAMVSHYGQSVDRIVFRLDDEPVAILQVFHKRLLGFASIVRIIRGPLFLGNPDPALRLGIYQSIHNVFSFRRWQVPFWLPEAADEAESRKLMRQVGTRRMVTGLSSAWLDLTGKEDILRGQMTGGWRNALTSAEKRDTTVIVEDNVRSLSGLMSEYDAFRKGKRFIGPPGEFIVAMDTGDSQGDNILALGAHADGKRIAGIILIRHGASATYFVSWTSHDGRKRNAHNLLLWHGILALRDRGTAWLDMGGLNTGSAAGIARFKLGLSPEPFTLAGTYL